METVTVYVAMNGAESAMVAGVLVNLGFDARATEDSGTQGGTPVNITYPVYVPADQADRAREALKAQGLAQDAPED